MPPEACASGSIPKSAAFALVRQLSFEADLRGTRFQTVRVEVRERAHEALLRQSEAELSAASQPRSSS